MFACMERNVDWETKIYSQYQQRAKDAIDNIYANSCSAASKTKLNNSEKMIKDLFIQWPQEDVEESTGGVLNSSGMSQN